MANNQNSEYQKGKFKEYRATNDIRVPRVNKEGKAEGQFTVYKDDVFDFDGYTFKYNDEVMTEGAAIRAAIKTNWFVPSSDTTTEYRPKPAGIKVRPAEMKDMSEAAAEKASIKMVLGDSTEDQNEVGTIDRSRAARKATQEPKARTSQKSRAEFGEEAEVTEGSTPVADFGAKARVVGKVTNRAAEKVEDLLDEEEEVVEAPTKKVTVSAAYKAKLDVVRNFYPGFKWDKKPDWKVRAKTAIKKGADDPMFLKAVMAVEDDNVKDYIRKHFLK